MADSVRSARVRGREPNSAIEVPGAVVGSDAAVIAQFEERVAATGVLHEATAAHFFC